jgi:hypothetical protein
LNLLLLVVLLVVLLDGLLVVLRQGEYSEQALHQR